jgi:hypothetical protein
VSLFFSAILVATALRGTLDVSNRAQLGARGGGNLTGATLDAETSPGVKIGVEARRWELTADYAPRFTASVAGDDPQTYVLQQGRLAARARYHRLSVSLSEDGGYGRSSLLSLGVVPGAAPGTIPLASSPANEILDYAWSRTGIVARLAATRRWGVTGLADLTLSGGAGATARTTLPFQTALHAGVGVDHAASRRDRVAALVDATKARFTTGVEDALLQGKVSWRHDLGRGLTTTFSSGLGWSTSRAALAPSARSAVVPIAEAGLAYKPRASDLDLGLTLRAAPVIDPFRGRIDQRFEATASGTWTPTRKLGVQAQIGLARSIPRGDGAAFSLGSGAVIASYRVNDVLQIDGGARSAWIAGAGIDSPVQWMVFSGATLRVPTLRF